MSDPIGITPSEIRAAGRRRVKLHGHEDLPLIEPDRGYVIRSGYLSVYLVRYDAGVPGGRRHYLFSCHEGCLLLGQPVIHESVTYGLVAVPLAEGECEEVTMAGWGKNEEEFLSAKHWCDHLCRMLSEDVSNEYAERADADGMFAIEQANKLRPQSSGIFSLVLESGRLRFFGHSHLELNPQSGRLMLMGDCWFGVEEEASGHFKSLQPGAASAGMENSLAFLSALYVRSALEKLRKEAEAEKTRMARLATLAQEAEDEGIQRLKFASDRPPATQKRETPLLTCLDAISESTGIKLKTESPPRTTLPILEQLGSIVRNSGTRMRKVRLEEGWWDSDGGTILAFKKEGKVPVVLLSVGTRMGLSRHYEILDPVDGKQVLFTPEMHADLEREGYVFLRPLPVKDGPITFLDLAKFTFAPFLKDMRLMFLLSLAGGILGAAMPVANRMMVDEVIPDANRRLLYDISIGMGVMSLGLFFFGMSQGLISLRVKTGLTAHLQSAIIDRLLRLPTRFFRKFSSGDLLNRAMMISEISAGFSMTVISALFGLLSTLLMLGMCFYYSQQMAFLAVVSALLTSVFSISFSYAIRSKALELEIRGGKLFGLLVQIVAGVSKLQTAGAETRAFKQWATEHGEQLHMTYRISYLSHWSGLINTVIQTLSTVALYYFAGNMVQQSLEMRAISPMTPPLLTVGVFFAVQGAFGSVIGGVASFFGTFLSLHQQAEKRKLVRPILEEPIEGGKGRIDPGRLDGHILVKSLSFRYAPNTPLVLSNVDLHAFPGEFIAIVGSSGSGKSTLLRLLLGFEAAESGQILFDKKDIKDLDMIAVRRQTGVVLQDGKINTGTIYHNIAGATQISLDDAWESAEAAGMGDDIRGMPMGMHTLIPEGGTTLSGGQKQRLLIARSLALKPRIIFFDEATSALDNRTQEIVTKSLGERRITRIIVAHRLSTIMNADRIYVFEQGMVVQKGTFKELASQEGPFKLMADRQMA